jgi:hypothetical protein
VRHGIWLLSAFCALELPAQTPGTLTGIVATSSGTPVAQARVEILGTGLYTVAGADGLFRLAGVPARPHTLDVRMIGYAPLQLAFEIPRGDTLHVKATLSPIPLAPLEVVSDVPVSPGMRGFEERRSRGPGVFFTREDIVRVQARQFTDILRRVPGVQIRPVSGGLGNNVSVQTRGSNCPMLFYLDGSAFPLPGDMPINHYVAPEEVIAIEVYSGSSEVPAQYNSSRFTARCGVILVWTRHGPEGKRPRD